MLTNALCELLRIDVPLVQAPIGAAASPELVAAVGDAGALGMLAATWLTDEQASDQIHRVRRASGRPFGVNLVLDFPVASKIDLCLTEAVPVVSTFWGDPAPVNALLRGSSTVHLHTVGSVEEARRAVDGGVDVIVAQGWEAGGHVRGGVSTMALVPAVVDAVAPVPVIAAGGIADGRGLAAVLALGAQAACVGTRFLAATEAATHDLYRRRLIGADAGDTAYTRCFDGGWPGTPHRVLRNATLARWEEAGSPPVGRPGEDDVVATDATTGCAHRRYTSTMPQPGMSGPVEDLAMYAGQSVGLVRDIDAAATIVHSIVADAVRVIERLHPRY